MNEITITVTGQAGTGKSALVQYIAETLQAQGISVNYRFICNEHSPRTAERLEQILEHIKPVTQVEVVEEQARWKSKTEKA